jgi:NPCBM-associated, NEW3 domain of alpha-galactosidase
MRRAAVLILLPLLFIQLVSREASTQVSRKKVTVEGTLELRFEDPVDGEGRQSYFLNTGEERFELVFSDGIPELRAGSRLRASGRMRSGKLNVEDGAVIEAATTNPAVGEQRQLLMLFNFQDNPNNKPWTAAYIQDLLFNQVNQYYQQMSYGQTWITGDMVGWYTIPVNSSDCSANRTQAAEDGARALGHNPDNYSHKIYIYPSTSCGSSGGTTWVSTDSSGNVRTWMYISGSATSYILTHEFGHSLAFRHSNSLSCGGVSFGTSCSNVEYGDNYDAMGYYNTGVINSYHRDLAQWLGPRIQTVTTGGTYTLTPTAVADNNPKAIRIQQAYNPTTNSTTYYYVEYRQPTGYDSFLSNYPAITGGVLLRLGTIGSDVNRLGFGSQLLDLTPTTTGRNEALAVGRSYYDAAIPVTVTVLSANSAGATVSVQFSGPTCSPGNPAVALSPSGGSPTGPGTSVPYTVTVTNNDSSSCVASGFNLQANLPNGWLASFATPTLTVSPGATASTIMTVTSSSSASSGSYAVGVDATNGSSAYSGSTSATYNVASALAVSVSTDRSRYTRKQWVTMTSNVSANGSPVQGASVSFTMTKSNGATVTQSATTGSNGSASARFQLRKQDPPGSYQGRGAASAGTVSGTAVTSFMVQ